MKRHHVSTWCFFVCKKMNEKEVICPKCSTVITKIGARQTIDVATPCRRCRVLVVYKIANGITEIKDMPVRNTSSGCRFN